MTEEAVTPTEEQEVQEEVTEEVESESTENEEAGTSEENTDEVEKPPKGRDAESRIKELNWKAKQAAEQAEFWRSKYEMREEFERSRAPQEPAKAEEQKLDLPPAPVPPDRFDFDSDADYNQAVANFQQEQGKYFNTVIEKREEAARAKAHESQRSQVLNQRQQTLSQKLEAGREKYPDFDAVVSNPRAPIDETMVEGLVDAENSADVAYYLASNPQEAAKISQMSPIQKLMAIGKLDAQMGATKKTKQTKAPAPPDPVKAGSSSGVIDPDKLDINTWRKLREEGKI